MNVSGTSGWQLHVEQCGQVGERGIMVSGVRSSRAQGVSDHHDLSWLSHCELYGQSYRVKQDITVADLGMRTQHVIGREIDVIRSQLARNHVTVLPGMGRFLEPGTIGVAGGEDREQKVTADRIVIATGTRPARPDTVEFDDRTVIDSDGTWSGSPRRWSWWAPG
jgi:pyruvate/2-oxoglutarate dehydrogenase complex dihydrolipoamide dehydrogenase (E3) component